MLVVWLGAFYHDEWLEAADLAHHHEHASHHETHGDDHDHGSDSIPLPDFHAALVLISKATCSLHSIQSFDLPDSATPWLEQDTIRYVDRVNAPPPDRELEIRPGFSLHLADCNQPNAPPTLV